MCAPGTYSTSGAAACTIQTWRTLRSRRRRRLWYLHSRRAQSHAALCYWKSSSVWPVARCAPCPWTALSPRRRGPHLRPAPGTPKSAASASTT
jgi:hypothetical protein